MIAKHLKEPVYHKLTQREAEAGLKKTGHLKDDGDKNNKEDEKSMTSEDPHEVFEEFLLWLD